jgi:hypothetical protein
VHGLSLRPGGQSVGRIDASTAAQLGVTGVTVFVVRPDRYLGFRDNAGRADVVNAYLDALVA